MLDLPTQSANHQVWAIVSISRGQLARRSDPPRAQFQQLNRQNPALPAFRQNQLFSIVLRMGYSDAYQL